MKFEHWLQILHKNFEVLMLNHIQWIAMLDNHSYHIQAAPLKSPVLLGDTISLHDSPLFIAEHLNK